MNDTGLYRNQVYILLYLGKKIQCSVTLQNINKCIYSFINEDVTS